MQPQDYTPVFDSSVFIQQKLPNGQFIFMAFVSPLYCLTEASAQQLIQVLSSYSPTVYDDYPVTMGPLGPYSCSAQVPWLSITKGGATIKVNAGVIANYYNHITPAPGQPALTAQQIAAIQQYYDGRCRADLDAQLVAAGAAL